MSGLVNILRRLDQDDRGEVIVEYVLLIAFFGVPMIAISAMMLSLLTGYYRMISLVHSLPFP